MGDRLRSGSGDEKVGGERDFSQQGEWWSGVGTLTGSDPRICAPPRAITALAPRRTEDAEAVGIAAREPA